MKNAVRNILSSVFIFLVGCLLLITCADPMSGVNVIGNGGGIITVTIGGNARKTVSWANTLDSDDFSHTITVSGGPGKAPPPHTIEARQTGTATFSVTPGLWTITVEAFYLGELVAKKSVTKQINMGDNGVIPITMEKPPGYPEYKVTFDANGGSFADGELEKIQQVNKYSMATLPEPDPTLGGKYFIDWYTDKADFSAGTRYDFDAPVTGDFPLYARWSEVAPFIVTFNKNHSDNDGEWTDAYPASEKALSGETVNLPLHPTRKGHTFAGWFTSNGAAFTEETPVTADITVNARWTANTYHVAFNNNGGTGTMSNQTFTYGTAQALKANTFTMSNHSFAGWARSPDGEKAYDDGQEVINLTSTANDTVTLYAVWTANNLVNASPPVITKQPAAINEIYLGDTIELTVTASLSVSGGHLTYQWYKKANAQDNDGTPLGTENGADTAAYKTPTTLAVGTYYYYCVVTNTDTSVNGNHTAPVTSGTAKVIVYGIGSGTKENPFIVHNVTTLERVGKGEGEWADWSLSAYYKQIKNITLLDPAPGEESNWTPIGTNVEDVDADLVIIPANSFIGTYDGNGKTISNLKINAPSADWLHPQGLFGCIGSSGLEENENVGIVKNVGIVNCDIKGNIIVGGVVGENHQGTVQNCYVMGDISGTNTVGGVVGENVYGMVQNCYATGNVSGSDSVGSFVGGVGGVVGRNVFGTVRNCYATGDISGTVPSGSFYADIGFGGVVGNNLGGTVQYCFATGNISGHNYSVGGVVGYNNDYYEGIVQSCMALNPNITKNLDGTDITSDDWGSADWWTGTAKFNETETAWDFTGINGTNLPKLKGMPGGTEAQNPVIITLP